MHKRPAYILPLIVFSQFAGTSLWFAGNAIINDIQVQVSGSANSANMTSVVQFGFISGTLVFSLLIIADRFPASKIFFFSSLVAATANILLIWTAQDILWIYSLRFITGFFLAGIYPVGMKIAADWFPDQLGKALGFLVGALVLGTAFPHAIKSNLQNFQWQSVIAFTSLLALTGGLLILLFVPSIKKMRTRDKIHLNAATTVFKSSNFRSAAFGYFGHMWELYALWAFVPVILQYYNDYNNVNLNISLWSFIIIGIGSVGCIMGGLVSGRTGSKPVAFYSLLISSVCCVFSFLFFQLPMPLFLCFMMIWGFTVVADSPQFSTLVAQSAPAENKGTAITIVTCIGFAITIVSVQLLKVTFDVLKQYGLLVLFIGPVFGLVSLNKFLVYKEDKP